MTRIHIVCLPHTLLTRDYDWCAYTAKCRRFVTMLSAVGIDALVYGPDIVDEDTRTLAADYTPIVTEADRVAWFGAPEWDKSAVFDRWDVADTCWVTMNKRAVAAIRERWQPGDILGLIGGLCQASIMTDLADLAPLTTEWGIGYSGIVPGTHRVYESYAWMHHTAGYYRDDDIRFYDDVIPNCFDPGDFSPRYKSGDYLLYMGRPTPRKGLQVITAIAEKVDLPIKIAGQSDPQIPGTEYVGLVTGKAKAKLLAGARALLTPTVYLEPFGGVAVEAMLSGTPVIATDYGAFTETVVNGVSGYRCRMLSDFITAVDQSADLNRRKVRSHAMDRYTLDVGASLYGNYLQRLTTLYGKGWYSERPDQP